ncbi:transposase [Corynebacterium uterequi]|uniref:Transposase n=1 Tax=Corynebacterium uterequi TaxID=1072256 RepID=A0A0G3HEL9_9CORY|nr:transposase [Corynebacterium uterequi]AKK10418.1 Transposase [Corynebacterium uterequi]
MATKKRRSPEDLIRALNTADELAATGASSGQIAAQLGVSAAPLYNWRKKYRGMDIDAAKQLKALKEETATLKRLLADKVVEADALREITKGKF